jgi:hypothetical protein
MKKDWWRLLAALSAVSCLKVPSFIYYPSYLSVEPDSSTGKTDPSFDLIDVFDALMAFDYDDFYFDEVFSFWSD